MELAKPTEPEFNREKFVLLSRDEKIEFIERGLNFLIKMLKA